MPREEWANRGPHRAARVGWKAQGKKVDPTALRLRRSRRSRSSARSSQAEAAVLACAEQHPRERRGGTSVTNNKRSQRSGVAKESLAQKRDASHPDQSVNDRCYDAPIAAARKG